MGDDKNSIVSCVPNPDIAGPGIVISFLIAAILSTSIVVFIHFERQRPRPHPRRVLEKVLTGLVQSQLVTGSALMVCTFIVYWGSFNDVHFHLAFCLSLLNISSIVPGVYLLVTNDNVLTAFYRLLCTGIYGIISGLAYGIITSDMMIVSGRSVLFLCAFGVGFSCLMSSINILHDEHRTERGKVLSTSMSGLNSIIAVIMIWIVVRFKYLAVEWCELNTGLDNARTFGQMLAMIVLGGP